MIFDDHDIRDDWNTSAQWRREMEPTDWWHERIVAGLASYWVYQHLGNLSPARARRRPDLAAHRAATRARTSSTSPRCSTASPTGPTRTRRRYRWSYARDIAETRLVVVDSRAARVLEDDQRSMLDDDEMAWLDEQMRGDVDHLLIGTSLPFLLPEGLHHLEAFSEALAGGAWGRRRREGRGSASARASTSSTGAPSRRASAEVAGMVMEVATGARGAAPRTVTFLSGDVHHSYVSQVVGPRDASKVVQAVCSPIRNPLPRRCRFATAALSYGVAGPIGLLAARSAKVPDPPFRWNRVQGAVVRQQPRDARGHRRRAGHVVGHGQRARGPSRPPGADLCRDRRDRGTAPGIGADRTGTLNL